jgi:predicted outer membrane protein
VKKKGATMRKSAALALICLAALTGTAWFQANIRPDPDPRVPPQPGQTLPVEDALFLKEAEESSQGQAELGRLAAEKAPDGALRGLAQRIAETHAKLSEDLKRLAGSRNLPPAEQLKPERTDALGAAGAVSNPENVGGGMAQEAIRSLSGLSGDAFGKGYVEAQLRIHDRLVDLYQTQASHTPDRELATFAITSLVAIQKNRDELRDIGVRFGVDAPVHGQAIQYGDPTKAR